MENSKKIKQSKIIFFQAMNNILFLVIIAFSNLIDNYDNNSWLVLILFIIIQAIIGLLFKGFKNDVNVIKIINKKGFIKLLFIIEIISSFLFTLLLLSITINKYFFYNFSIIAIILLILTTTVILSSLNLSNLISLSTVFFIIIIPFYIIPLTHYEERSFSLLLPINFDISFYNILKSIIIIIFPLEHIIYSTISFELDKGYSRKTFIITNVIEGLYILFILVDSLTLLGSTFYKSMPLGGLLHWFVYQGNKFIENYDFFIIIIIIITTIFKLAFYINLLQKLLLFKKTKINYSILFLSLFILSLILYSFVNHFFKILNIYMYILLLLLIVIYIYIVKLSRSLERKGNNDY